MERNKLYLSIATLATLVSIFYWSAFAINSYNSFQGNGDLGAFTYGMYSDIHYPNVVHGLQYIVFDNHLSVDLLALLPFFYIHQSTTTLLIIQAVVLSLTGLLLFFISKDLLKSPLLGLLFCIAFLINPGMQGMLVFGFHVEFLIIPLYLLMFYFYMKLDKKWFFVSILLFLLIMEVAPFLSLALGLGLFIFDYFYTQDRKIRKQRLILAASLMLFSITALLLYDFAAAGLVHSYNSGQYSGLSPILKINPVVQKQIKNLTNSGSFISQDSSRLNIQNLALTLYGVLTAFLGFGLAVFGAPITALILGGAWLSEFFLMGQYGFIVIWEQYFSYVLGGTIVSAILGINLIREKKGFIAKRIARIKGKNYDEFARKSIIISMVAFSLILFLLSPIFVQSTTKASIITNYTQSYLFQTSPHQNSMYEQLDSAIMLVPPNASLMTADYIMPHVAERGNIEVLKPIDGYNTYYFLPDYILTDFNMNVSQDAFTFGQEQYVLGFLQNHTGQYSVYFQNGTAILYKKLN